MLILPDGLLYEPLAQQGIAIMDDVNSDGRRAGNLLGDGKDLTIPLPDLGVSPLRARPCRLNAPTNRSDLSTIENVLGIGHHEIAIN